jgi:mono/diheme cytochrome c family protein
LFEGHAILKLGPIAVSAAAIITTALLSHPARADDPPVPPASAAPAAKTFDVKSTFRNICGFCHEDYGRKAGKGPQLMGDTNTDEYLFNRIKNGKPGRMAAFGSIYNDDQIHQIVVFIRALRPDANP